MIKTNQLVVSLILSNNDRISRLATRPLYHYHLIEKKFQQKKSWYYVCHFEKLESGKSENGAQTVKQPCGALPHSQKFCEIFMKIIYASFYEIMIVHHK